MWDDENVMTHAGSDASGVGANGGHGAPVPDVPAAGTPGDVGDGPPPDDPDDVESLGFPPGHFFHISDAPKLGRRRGDEALSPVNPNPSILPSYLFCPLTGVIIADPVVTPSGNTYERMAVLRWLVLFPGDPLDGRPLRHEDLEEDRMVRRAIDEARKEAWVRYVAELDGGTGLGGDVEAGPAKRIRTDAAAKRAAVKGSNMKICGACERELPDDSYSRTQRGLRQSSRRCEECVAAGNKLVLMRKGRTRSEEDDCPICNLPLPLDGEQSVFHPCCLKEVCKGCDFAAEKRGMEDCPFCRTPTPKKSQTLAMIQKRVDAGDPVAIWNLGSQYDSGQYGLEKDVTRAVELYERAAELGVKDAHYNLGVLYSEGEEVAKDMDKAIRHYEVSAMCGHVLARYNLGCIEGKAENYDLSLQHFSISAKLGDQESLNMVKTFFMNGLATKADYAAALCGYQSAIEEMSSPERDEAKVGF